VPSCEALREEARSEAKQPRSSAKHHEAQGRPWVLREAQGACMPEAREAPWPVGHLEGRQGRRKGLDDARGFQGTSATRVGRMVTRPPPGPEALPFPSPLAVCRAPPRQGPHAKARLVAGRGQGVARGGARAPRQGPHAKARLGAGRGQGVARGGARPASARAWGQAAAGLPPRPNRHWVREACRRCFEIRAICAPGSLPDTRTASRERETPCLISGRWTTTRCWR
jgi:hypothetical protein